MSHLTNLILFSVATNLGRLLGNLFYGSINIVHLKCISLLVSVLIRDRYLILDRFVVSLTCGSAVYLIVTTCYEAEQEDNYEYNSYVYW